MFSYVFMQNALLGILVLTPLLALIGTIVVNNKMAFFSDAIGHSALTGVGFGVLLGLGINNIAIAIFSAILAIIITILKLNQNSNTETIISIVSSISVALGIVILSINGSFAKYTSYIIGDILSITKNEIFTMFIVFLVVGILIYYIYNKLVLISINSTLAKSRGINVVVYELIFSIIVAVVVALSIKWVGVLVINSLIVIPCATSRIISSNIKQYIIYSILISLISGIAGLVISYTIDASSAATIVLVNGTIYMLVRLFNRSK